MCERSVAVNFCCSDCPELNELAVGIVSGSVFVVACASTNIEHWKEMYHEQISVDVMDRHVVCVNVSSVCVLWHSVCTANPFLEMRTRDQKDWFSRLAVVVAQLDSHLQTVRQSADLNKVLQPYVF